MSVSSGHMLRQGPVLAALARTLAAGLAQRVGGPRGGAPETPGPELRRRIAPPPRSLVEAFVAHLGGEPSRYRGEIPPHLFPHWTFPLAARILEGLPYPLLRAVNGGCRMEVRAPLPADAPLELRARLESVEETDRRARLVQRVVTGTASAPEALVTDLHVVVPIPAARRTQKPETSPERGEGRRRERPRAPLGAREIARERLPRDAGLSFAKLTGDVNPIHWLPVYARASGFRDVILHGFGTFARAAEGLVRSLLAGDPHRLRVLDLRFTRPLVLPAEVGLYACDDALWVADAPGAPAYATGRFEAAKEES